MKTSNKNKVNVNNEFSVRECARVCACVSVCMFCHLHYLTFFPNREINVPCCLLAPWQSLMRTSLKRFVCSGHQCKILLFASSQVAAFFREHEKTYSVCLWGKQSSKCDAESWDITFLREGGGGCNWTYCNMSWLCFSSEVVISPVVKLLTVGTRMPHVISNLRCHVIIFTWNKPL